MWYLANFRAPAIILQWFGSLITSYLWNSGIIYEGLWLKIAISSCRHLFGELFNIQREPLIGFENKNYIKPVICLGIYFEESQRWLQIAVSLFCLEAIKKTSRKRVCQKMILVMRTFRTILQQSGKFNLPKISYFSSHPKPRNGHN